MIIFLVFRDVKTLNFLIIYFLSYSAISQYIKVLGIEIPSEQSLVKTKKQIAKIKNVFLAITDFRPIRFIVDVNPY